MTEIWLAVGGYESRYDVSDMGRVRSWTPSGPGRSAPSEPRILKSTNTDRGYHVVTLRDCYGKTRQHRLHCLVLETFVGPRPEGYHGAHDDDNKDNNQLSNLAWKPPIENYRDRDRNGGTACGERHGRYTHGKFVGRSRLFNK